MPAPPEVLICNETSEDVLSLTAFPLATSHCWKDGMLSLDDGEVQWIPESAAQIITLSRS